MKSQTRDESARISWISLLKIKRTGWTLLRFTVLRQCSISGRWMETFRRNILCLSSGLKLFYTFYLPQYNITPNRTRWLSAAMLLAPIREVFQVRILVLDIEFSERIRVYPHYLQAKCPNSISHVTMASSFPVVANLLFINT